MTLQLRSHPFHCRLQMFTSVHLKIVMCKSKKKNLFSFEENELMLGVQDKHKPNIW